MAQRPLSCTMTTLSAAVEYFHYTMSLVAYQDDDVGVVAVKGRQLEQRQDLLVRLVQAHAQRAVRAQKEHDEADQVHDTVLGWTPARSTQLA